MRPRSRQWQSPAGQGGFSLATALFVITVMAFLAVVINQLIRSNAESAAEEIVLSKAFYAAESGAQFGVNAAFPPNPAVASSCPGAGSPTTYPTFTADGINNCRAEVTCEALTVGSNTYYTITSRGICGELERVIQVRAE